MEAPLTRLRGTLQYLSTICLYLLAWMLLDLVAGWFEAAPEIPVWYVPSALTVALLLLFGLRFWPALLLSTPLHVAAMGYPAVLADESLLVLGAATTAGYAGAALVLVRVLGIDPGLRQRQDVVWFVAIAVFGAPLFVATARIGGLSAAHVLLGPDLLLNVSCRFAGEALGVAMLAPVLLVLGRRMPATRAYRPALPHGPGRLRPALRPRPPVRVLAAEAAGSLAALWVAYGWQRPASLDYTVLSWLPVIWASLRYGFERAAVTVLVADVVIALLVVFRPPGVAPFALQSGLLAFTAAALLLGAYATDLQRNVWLLRYQSLYDTLTGLPNRMLFRTRLERALAAPSGSKKTFMVAVLDLDDFKGVNDALGHEAGDSLLVAAGRRLQAGAALGDVVARMGGDQFGLLLHLPDPAAAPAALDRVLDQFSAPLVHDGVAQRLTATAGATIYPAGEEGPDGLVGQADLALHAAKRAGRAERCFYSQEMQEQLRTQRRMGKELARALNREQLVLHFQPQVDIATRRIIGAEALVRWMHPERGLLMPGAFLEFVESAGLMARLGGWVLRQACAQATAWPGGIAVSVNVAPAQWRAGQDLAAQVGQALAAGGLPPGRLKLEITEDALVAGEEARSLSALNRLRSMGVRVSMDDFGTGHSGLSRLRRMPVDEVKMDRSFVTGIGRDAGDEAIARAVVSLAQSLGHQVIAEGVETEAQLAFLQGIGCGMAQGYLFSRPLDIAALSALLAGGMAASKRGA